MYYTVKSSAFYCLTNAFSEAKQLTVQALLVPIQQTQSTSPLQKAILSPMG